MCVIAFVPAGKPLPSFAMFHRQWEANPHGAGMMFPVHVGYREQSIKLVKGLTTFTQFKDAIHRHRSQFADAENRATVDIAFHFRIASAGGNSPKLTHPFFAGADVAMMHNGHIGMLAYDDSSLNRELAGASPKPSKSQAQALSIFKDERENELRRLKEMVEAGEITHVEAEDFAARYLDKPSSNRVNRGAELTAERLARLENPESDTSRLASILARLPTGWQRNEVCHFLIKEKFLHGDKVVIFDSKGLAVILNEDRGTWDDDGRWYSNTYWMPTDRHAGKLVSGQEMLADKDESTSFSSTTSTATITPLGAYGLNTGKTDRELRAQSDEMKKKLNERVFQPLDNELSEARRRRNTPLLGCTYGSETAPASPASAPSLPPGMSSESGECE